MTAFDTVWSYLHVHFKEGSTIRNWTTFGGYLGDSMKVIAVGDNFIEVDAPNAKNIQFVPKMILKECGGSGQIIKLKNYDGMNSEILLDSQNISSVFFIGMKKMLEIIRNTIVEFCQNYQDIFFPM